MGGFALISLHISKHSAKLVIFYQNSREQLVALKSELDAQNQQQNKFVANKFKTKAQTH